MRKTATIFILAFLIASVAYAQLTVIGSGGNMAIDTSGFPPGMQAAYNLMTHKCTRCHTLERIIESVRTGITPITRMAFNKQTSESVVVRMYLKPDANLSRREAKTVLDFLNFLLDTNTPSVAEKKFPELNEPLR